jgi:hypothetical protein
MTRAMTSGPGRLRTGTRRSLAALRCDRPRGAGGHGSTSMTLSSTARRMQALDTFRKRPAVAEGLAVVAHSQPPLDLGQHRPGELPQLKPPLVQPRLGLRSESVGPSPLRPQHEVR